MVDKKYKSAIIVKIMNEFPFFWVSMFVIIIDSLVELILDYIIKHEKLLKALSIIFLVVVFLGFLILALSSFLLSQG